MSAAGSAGGRGQWSGRWAFVLAAAGSAVGLGNIWKFPYMTGENGGSAFVLVYIAAVVIVALPVLIAEVMLGRRAQRNPVGALALLASEARASRAWRVLGMMGVVTGFLILSFYSVVAGWMLDYLAWSARGEFAGFDAEAAQARFASLLGDPWRLLLWHSVFMLMTVLVVGRGVARGLERANKLLMPALIGIVLVLLAYGVFWGNIGGALSFMFQPDFSKISPSVALAAMGQAFFSLSVGMGAMMVYGSYLGRDAPIPHACAAVALVDTLVALLAGVAVFAIVFAHEGLAPAAGPGLVLKTLPVAFSDMPGGRWIGTLFFILLIFAAWTSAISLLEPITAWATENTRLGRLRAAALVGTAIWFLGIAVVLSFNEWQDIRLAGLGIFDALDYLTSNILLPLGGFLIAVFAAWIMRWVHTREELDLRTPWYEAWHFTVRYISPVAIALIFLNVTGVLPAFG